MSSKYIQDYDVPKGFIQTLHDYTREILRDQPEDIIEYSSNYFNALLSGAEFKYVSKYNIHRTKQVSNRKFEYSDHKNYKMEHYEIGVKSVPPVRKNFLHIDEAQQDQKDLKVIQTSLDKSEINEIPTEQKFIKPDSIEVSQKIEEPKKIDKQEEPQQELQKIVQEEEQIEPEASSIEVYEGVENKEQEIQKEEKKQPKASDKVLGFLKNAPGEIAKKSNESSQNLRRSIIEGVDSNQQEEQNKIQEEQNKIQEEQKIPEEQSKASDKILGFIKNAPSEIAKKATESSQNLRRSIEGIENNEESLYLQINVMQALGLPFNQQDARCCLLLGEKREQTKIIYNEPEPKWNEIIMFSKIQEEDLLTNQLKITLLQDVDACIGQVDITISEKDIRKEGQFFLNKYIEVPNKLTDKKVFLYVQARVGKQGKEYEVTQFAENVQDEEETIRKAIAIEYQAEK